MFPRYYLSVAILAIFMVLKPVCPESDPAAEDSELAKLDTMLSVLQNMSLTQHEIVSQQELQEQEMKARHKLEEENEKSRTQAMREELNVLKDMRRKLYRKLKTVRRISAIYSYHNGSIPSGKPGPKDCADVYLDGEEDSGVYRVWSSWNFNRSFFVYCDMDTDGGGWTLIQREGSQALSDGYFQRPWSDYRNGFGDLSADFWLGNENIASLTSQGPYNIRFDIVDGSRKRFSVYNRFWIEGETRKYKLHVNGYLNYIRGGAGDVFSKHNEGEFSTFDKNFTITDQHCFDQCVVSKDHAPSTRHYTTSIGGYDSEKIRTCETRCKANCQAQNQRGWWFKKYCAIDDKLKVSSTARQLPQANEMKIRPAQFLKSKENL